MRDFLVGGAITMLAASATFAAPAPGVDWDWQLSERIAPPAGIAAFDADKDSAPRAKIKALNSAGVYTICYVSVGTVENYRDDVDAFPASVVGKTYGDWPDEKFLDIRQIGTILPIMRARFQACKRMGFDAIEPDNMDVYENESGFQISATETVRYLLAIADLAHGMGMEVGQKNVPELTPYLIDHFDFIITESCFRDRWCDQVAAYTAAGKPIFDAEYTDRGINWNKACKLAERMNISMILKNRDLGPGRKSCNE